MATKKGKINLNLASTVQEELLEDCKKRVQTESFYMKRCLDNGKLVEALKHATTMIGQLRTGLLTAQNYYELYITTFNQLQYLQSFLSEEREKGENITKLYELVQYAGNILPRLYLLVTVGSVYIKSKEAPAKDVLKDMVEMCKGVQHPTRGLFLRNYLSEMSKDKLPDDGTEYHGDGGNVNDCIEFILQNFIEMNKLWVRMQHQSVMTDPTKIEKERLDIRLLVGTNLSRLSQLEGVDCDIYTTSVLPRILEQVVVCKDKLAQQYLMECIIQVFPSLEYIDTILKTCCDLHAGVDLKAIIVCLIERLGNYAVANETSLPTQVDVLNETSLPTQVDVFGFFYKNLANIIKERSSMPLADILQLIVALLKLSMQCYPDNLENVDRLLVFCSEVLSEQKENGVDITAPSASKQIVVLLNQPLVGFKNILRVLSLEHYPTVMSYLSYNTRKRVSEDIAKNAVKNNTIISSAEHVNCLFEFIATLIQDQDDQPAVEDFDMEDFEEEQQLVGSLVHLFKNSDLKQQSAMYVTARKHFASPGPTLAMRIAYTLPPLIFASLKLAVQVLEELPDVAKKVFKFVHETISGLAKADNPELSLKLFVNAALAASACEFEEIAYEFVTQAFVMYEENISDSKLQFSSLQLMIGALHQMRCFSNENYETLITKTAQHASRLLIKPNQCRAIYTVSHLFWTPSYKDGKRVLECLQKSLKIADTCMETEVNLFVEILKQYLYYFINDNEAIDAQYLVGLLALINTNLDNKEVDLQSSVNSH
eukprot:CAMPEP_0117011558 /NCGR_PEP_ID=MMETSP0472-20121206/9917_1 /TAXON_ID=693140 ORGANISM="Tiarina fusus, Strain LIS" /NCGR_SAMPLE_ID=MMETSP0472 /ASSEMBLY_ACC=CAM_ASM_000603 /LENGTH=766 /DNA_ID=CAMNT_0004714405 /DNA_START=22 /DNA_END=2320 /DNA_ORIENTATION=+